MEANIGLALLMELLDLVVIVLVLDQAIPMSLGTNGSLQQIT